MLTWTDNHYTEPPGTLLGDSFILTHTKMKSPKIFFLLSFLFALTFGHAQCRFDNDKVIVVSHRGDWRNAAENSLEAFNYSINMGVNMIELDLKKTKDGELICLHDETLDRTTTGTGVPSNYTLKEIKDLYLRNGCGIPTSQRIPTLREALKAIKGKIWVNIDKGYDYFDDVTKILKETNTASQVVIKASQPYQEVLKSHPDVFKDAIFMPVIDCEGPMALQHVDEYIQKVHPVAFELNFGHLTPQVYEVINKVKASGSKIWMNSLWPSLCAGHNDDRAVLEHQYEETWGKLIQLGASFIQTDRPLQLIRYLKDHNLYAPNQSPSQIRERLKNNERTYGFIVSHRGDWLRYPENSLGAFQGAIQLGADILETDVQKTKDGVLVISHDESIDRCTDGKGLIKDMTFAEIRKFHLKNRLGKLTEYVIPSLEETMLLCKGKILVNLDKSERFIDETMKVLKKTGTTNLAILKSDMDYDEVMSKYGKYLNYILYMPIVNLDKGNATAKLKEFSEKMHPFAFEINFKNNSSMAEKVDDIIQHSSLLWFNSLQGRNQGHDDLMSLSMPELGFGFLISHYKANIIQTDIPQYLLEYYKAHDLRK
jgi:glycerophosphoryl diester phosphodiesterase